MHYLQEKLQKIVFSLNLNFWSHLDPASASGLIMHI